MIHWKLSALSVAVGAAATFGFVWLSRTSRARRLPQPPTPREHQPTPDEAARRDALHDLEGNGEGLPDLALDDAADLEPIDVRSLDEEPLAGDEPVAGDEHYDAIDPEEMGTEWLRRATESPEPASSPKPFLDERADVAAELPVGTIDWEGNTELHQPKPSEKPGTELSPNEAELAQRGATEGSPGGSHKPNE
jgi:phenylpropionate dioxygenase-like ring-hydroxylating dioxygenase large terminal subunit